LTIAIPSSFLESGGDAGADAFYQELRESTSLDCGNGAAGNSSFHPIQFFVHFFFRLISTYLSNMISIERVRESLPLVSCLVPLEL
jgi:hypothetical protein